MVFMCNGTSGDVFFTAIADIGCLIQPFTSFTYKVLTGSIAGRAGSTFYTADDDFFTGIRFFTVISVNTEIFCVVKRAFMKPVI